MTPSGSLSQSLARDRAVVHLRDPRLRHQLLEDDLVHADGARQDARAHVRHVEQLEQALNGAVLAERAVQDREDDVHAGKPPPGRDA